MIDPNEFKTMQIFMPHAFKRIVAAMERSQHFVHYTSSAVALSILQKREIWLRKTSCMNDYQEVAHGLDCIGKAWQSTAGKDLQSFLDALFPGIVEDIIKQFSAWENDMQLNTYITCVSEHYAKEDKLGRLSMWRAYGGSSGVALVINGSPFFRTENTINVVSTPVAYLDGDAFQLEFESVVQSIKEALYFVQEMPREDVLANVFNLLYMAALATKHPGFEEEQEWRVIHAPNMYASGFLTKSIEVVNGQPQTVYKLPFRNNDEFGVDWVDLGQILERVVIGPCENGHAIQQAFWDVLEEHNVPNFLEKVVVSDIPLR